MRSRIMDAIVADTPEKISRFQLATLKSALYLESKGMKKSRGPSAVKIAKGMGFKGKNANELRESVKIILDSLPA